MKYLLIIIVPMVLGSSTQEFDLNEVAPDIEMTSFAGDTLKLSSLRGKMVFLDFWASWCKPCRKENPEIVRMYLKYKDEEFDNGVGFTVFSVSLDKKYDAWKKAINKDGLAWDTHVSDLKGWRNEAAVQYGISSLPMSYLIDGEGRIVAINPRGHKLEKELKKNLKSNSFFRSLFDW